MCNEVVDYTTTFVPLDGGTDGPKKTYLIPLLFFCHPIGDSNNNAPGRFIGHPMIIQLPSTLPATEFHEFIKSVIPFSEHEYVVKNSSWDVSNFKYKCVFLRI